MSKSQSTIYKGIYIRFEDRRDKDVNVTVDGRPLSPKPSQRLRNHSPCGFSWGYGGNGPAQLALAILLDYYGHEKLVMILANYQDFKFRVIAGLSMDEGWELTGEEIEIHMKEIEREKTPVNS